MRRRVVQELLVTERDYVRDMAFTVKAYLNPLRGTAEKPYPILTVSQVNALFSNLSMLANVNRELLVDLEKTEDARRLLDSTSSTFSSSSSSSSSHTAAAAAPQSASTMTLGECFLKLSDYLKMYTQYCANQNTAFTLLRALRKGDNPHSKFIRFCAEVTELPESRGLELQGFLIKPVQRLCKYPLLLRELIKYTPPHTQAHRDVSAAYEKLSAIVAEVNEGRKVFENLQRIMDIRENMEGSPAACGVELVQPSRTFQRAGTFLKLILPSRKPVLARQYFMFNDLLIYCRPQLPPRKEFLYEGIIFFQGAVVDVLGKSSSLECGLRLHAPAAVDGPLSTFLIQCESISERDSLLADIQLAINELERTAKSRQLSMPSLNSRGTARLASPSAVFTIEEKRTAQALFRESFLTAQHIDDSAELAAYANLPAQAQQHAQAQQQSKAVGEQPQVGGGDDDDSDDDDDAEKDTAPPLGSTFDAATPHSYALLARAAAEAGRAVAVPQFVLIGTAQQGKTRLLEALCGFALPLVDAQQRVLCVHLRHDPTVCAPNSPPLADLLAELPDRASATLAAQGHHLPAARHLWAQADLRALPSVRGAHGSLPVDDPRLGAALSARLSPDPEAGATNTGAEPVHLVVRHARFVDLTLLDTPPLHPVVSSCPTVRFCMRLASRAHNPPHLLCVREADPASPPLAASLLASAAQRIGQPVAACVHTKLSVLASLLPPAQLLAFLQRDDPATASAPMPLFYTSLPALCARNTAVAAGGHRAFRRLNRCAERRDQATLRRFGFEAAVGARVGFVPLRGWLGHCVRRHYEQAFQFALPTQLLGTLPSLQTYLALSPSSSSSASAYLVASTACSSSSTSTCVATSSAFSSSGTTRSQQMFSQLRVLTRVFRSLVGGCCPSWALAFTQDRQQELAGSSVGEWLTAYSPGLYLLPDSHSTLLRLPQQNVLLFGGQQLQRVLREFEEVIRKVNIDTNLLGCSSLQHSPAAVQELLRDAVRLAETQLRLLFSCCTDHLFDRFTFILERTLGAAVQHTASSINTSDRVTVESCLRETLTELLEHTLLKCVDEFQADTLILLPLGDLNEMITQSSKKTGNAEGPNSSPLKEVLVRHLFDLGRERLLKSILLKCHEHLLLPLSEQCDTLMLHKWTALSREGLLLNVEDEQPGSNKAEKVAATHLSVPAVHSDASLSAAELQRHFSTLFPVTL